MRISVVIPALNEADGIAATLQRLRPLRARGHEVLVVDGGSTDPTAARAAGLCDRLLQAPRGRARQMNAGARAAHGDVLWFLHADTVVPADADALLLDALARCAWGRFDVRLSGTQPLLRVVESLMNLRSRITGIATGDQGLFVRREAFERVGGFPDIPLMEDIALSRTLRRHGPPACLRARLVTSSRRWERYGVLRTILLMWRLRFDYWRGVPPERLAARYRQG
ncbi:MAG: TIGR04283 family arsenosugar biosynthesis glycosyltransferase [Gammaproteobacteria bacterium]|nr:TIGR04283 family arsenosugar biosynthesis glycosyltransferase [Gammaproteobacteria bacterium]